MYQAISRFAYAKPLPMATNFFERQTTARRNTKLLVVLFLLAVLGIVGATFAAATLAIGAYRQKYDALAGQPQAFPWQIPLVASGGALALVGGGSLFKVVELRAGGGRGVASRLGGKLLTHQTGDFQEKRLLNVVEEMAIASGVPVPPVYLMEEQAINAFAAGYSPSDAVLGVTRGTLNQLNREELQGVIAHEFSHVLNGDMRMSIRLIGILHGILLLGLVGQIFLRSMAYGGGRRDRNGGSGMLAILAIAVALIALGYIGTFFGGLIKAAVSRQREYLADASAVQFTRNPGGIAGALKHIAASIGGSRLKAPAAAEASHMFFAQGVWEGFTSLMATHPPLDKRIRAIEPNWDGSLPKSKRAASNRGTPAQAAAFAGSAELAASPDVASDEVPPELVDRAVENVGAPDEAHRQYARSLITTIPAEVTAAARETFGARAVIYCLLLDHNKIIRDRQVQALRTAADPAVLRAAGELHPAISKLDARYRLPLVDMSLGALRSMSAPQFEQFTNVVRALTAADEQLDLFEWTLGRVIERHLEPEFRGKRTWLIRYYAINRLAEPISKLLSTIAHVGHEPAEAEVAFQSAISHLPELKLAFEPRTTGGLSQLKEVLATLSTVTAKHRGRIVDACAAVICADGEVKVAEAELLRGISDLLDCPMPPIVAGAPVQPAAEFLREAKT